MQAAAKKEEQQGDIEQSAPEDVVVDIEPPSKEEAFLEEFFSKARGKCGCRGCEAIMEDFIS